MGRQDVILIYHQSNTTTYADCRANCPCLAHRLCCCRTGKYLTSAAPGLELPAFIRRNMEIATQVRGRLHHPEQIPTDASRRLVRDVAQIRWPADADLRVGGNPCVHGRRRWRLTWRSAAAQ